MKSILFVLNTFTLMRIPFNNGKPFMVNKGNHNYNMVVNHAEPGSINSISLSTFGKPSKVSMSRT
jgi:hypothetical protein